jgi:lauroyl/myristoyl acyltransferase
MLVLCLTDNGRSTYWRMRSVFGRGRPESFFLAYHRLARGFEDFVVACRIAARRDTPENWRVHESNAHAVARLRDAGTSYIVAGGHFRIAPSYALYLPAVCPGTPIRIWKERVQEPPSVQLTRETFQAEAHRRALGTCLHGRVVLLSSGVDLRSARKMLGLLNEPGNVLFIDADLPWSQNGPGTYVRPFAGQRSVRFSTGIAQLARVAKRPVIGCMTLLRPDGTIDVQWSEPLLPTTIASLTDEAVMDRLLDPIEAAVGHWPGQYALDIGDARYWDRQSKSWR